MKVLITPPSFARTDDAPYKLLENHGVEYVKNKTDIPFTAEEMTKHIADCDGVILGVDPCGRDVLSAAARLKVISRFGVGIDNIDTEYCQAQDIAVYRTVGVNSDAVADCAFTLIMAGARKIIELDKDVKAGRWYEAETFEVCRKTLGLIGFGDIGSKVAKRAAGFDMKVIAYDVIKNEEMAKRYGVEYVNGIEEVLKNADFISLHLPSIPETYHLIGKKELSLMKPNAVIVNTARGGIIDEAALTEALKHHKILGAGLDVFENEPVPANSRLKQLDNAILLPHCSADTFETTRKVSQTAAENVLRGLGLME